MSIETLREQGAIVMDDRCQSCGSPSPGLHPAVQHEGEVQICTDQFHGELFLLQNNNGGYVGNSPVFWREGGSGYTPWIDDAKRFTKDEAEIQIRSTRGSHSWTMWPVEMIERAAKRTVDMQDLHRMQEAEFRSVVDRF